MKRTTFCTALCLLAAPLGAATVPIVAGQAYSFGGTLDVDGTTVFSFEVTEALNIQDFALTASDTNGGFDIQNASFDYDTVLGDTFDTILSSSGTLGDRNATGTGVSFVQGWGGYQVGDLITFTFNDGIEDAISLGLSFQTTPAQVPIPASGALLVIAGAFFAISVLGRNALKVS